MAALKALALLPLLAACATGPVVREERPYLAVGNEPFHWTLTISNGTISFESTEAGSFSIPQPRARRAAGRLLYDNGRFSVEIGPGPCSDGTGNRSYADSVRLVFGDIGVAGCGGDWTEPAAPARTEETP